jgi:glucan phosphoethanolaminetransferase (alkaline phosphatase superfamily)
MQNHGGYSDSQLFPDQDTVIMTDYPEYRSISQYLSLLRVTDQAFQTLIDYFKQQKEHTIILMFGDHQPVVYSTLHNAQEGQTGALQKKYEVPFILWANYDIPEETVDKISANYLSSYLLKTAGLKGTKYNYYLMELYQKVPVINALFYIDKDNIQHSFSDSTPYSELINEYKFIGYNSALDKKNKLDQYYYLN